jgi:hypothetical protein
MNPNKVSPWCDCVKKRVKYKHESRKIQSGIHKNKIEHTERCVHCGKPFITWMSF